MNKILVAEFMTMKFHYRTIMRTRITCKKILL